MKIQLKYFDQAIEWIFLGLLLLTAIIFDRRIGIVFSLTKITFMRQAVIIILTIWCIKLLLGGKFRFFRTPLDWPVATYLLAVTAATVTSVQVLISFMGFYGRFEGLTTWYVFGLFFLVAAQYFRGMEKLKEILALLAPAACIMAIYGIIQRYLLDPYAWGGVVTWQRVIATIGQPNFLAAYNDMVFFLFLYLFLEPKLSGGPGILRSLMNLIPWKKKAEPVGKSNKHKTKFVPPASAVKEDRLEKYLPLLYFFAPILTFMITIYSLSGEQVLLWYLCFGIMAVFSVLFALKYKDLPEWILTWLWGSSMVLSYICMFFTQSRGGYLGFAVGMVLFVLLIPRKLILGNLKKLGALMFILILVTYWVAFVQDYSPFARFSSEISVKSESGADEGTQAAKTEVKSNKMPDVQLGGAAGSRGETWKSAYGIIADNPVFGIGPEVLKMVFPRYETELFRFKETFHVKQDRCHNETFDVAVTKGLIGFFAYFWIIFMVYKVGLEKWRGGDEKTKLMMAALLSAAASYIIQNQFSFGVVVITSLFWVIWAMVCNVDARPYDEETREISTDDIPWIPVAAVLIVSLLLIYLSTIQFRADRLFKTAKTYSEMGRLGEAIPQYDQSLKVLPYEGGAITHYAIALLNYSNQLGEPQRSEMLQRSKNILEYGMKVDPFNADNFYIESRIFLMTGEMDRAIEFAEKALKIDPYYAEAHLTLANVYERRGQALSAKEHYAEALRINPELAEPKIKTAWSLFDQGRYEEAFQMFQELMVSDPKNADVHNGLGAIYSKRGDKARAKEEFEQTLLVSPGNPYAQKMLQWLK